MLIKKRLSSRKNTGKAKKIQSLESLSHIELKGGREKKDKKILIRFECSKSESISPATYRVYFSYHCLGKSKEREKEKEINFICDDKGFIDFSVS